jgi:hypothetical protein
LRTNVARLIGDWELDDPNPTRYTAILERMVRSAPTEGATDSAGCDAQTILKMALELRALGPAVYLAVEALLKRRELVPLAKLLHASPRSEAAEAVWKYIATPERLATELTATPLDPEAVAILVGRMGADATDALLDRLASAEDRSTRAAILKQLLALGPEVGRIAVARLVPDAPWYVVRNILLLIGRLGNWPQGFTPMDYAGNPDVRIRREAIKLLLESSRHVTEGIMLGLRDVDDGIAALAAAAALEACPASALPLVERITVDVRRGPELRAITLRILARTRAPEALRLVLMAALNRRLWFGRRLAPKSPLLLAALSALANYWREHPTAVEILTLAHQHSDAEIRAAAMPSQTS